MRFAFIGDVVGRAGREGLADHLPHLRRALGLEFVIINAENAAAGFGITENTARELFDAGADCLTLGNHSWDQKEAMTYIVREPRLIRPLNYSAFSAAPGRGSQLFDTPGGQRILVINLLGRVFMDALDDPFAAVDKELEACPLGAVAEHRGEPVEETADEVVADEDVVRRRAPDVQTGGHRGASWSSGPAAGRCQPSRRWVTSSATASGSLPSVATSRTATPR